MEFQFLQVSQQAGVCEIAWRRPERKNAFHQALYAELTTALAGAVGATEVRAILLRGDESCFTSGNDLTDFVGPGQEFSADLPLLRFMAALLVCPKPVVAAVAGVAIGIGSTLLLHCDLVYAAPGSQFALPFVKLGLCPEFGASFLLPRMAGLAKASEWLLLGEPFSAEDALAVGLINRIVADPITLARGKAEALARLPAQALMQSKNLLRAPVLAAVQAAMQKEEATFAQLLQGPAFGEALAAFLAKRPADFSAC